MTTQYKLQKNSFGVECAVTIIGQNISIPFDASNTDYQAYLKWLEEGGVPEPADQGEQA
jgi:hypothetical protein